MGTLVNGKWTQKSLAQLRAEGKDIQVDPGFRNWITQMAQRGQLVRVGLRLRRVATICMSLTVVRGQIGLY